MHLTSRTRSILALAVIAQTIFLMDILLFLWLGFRPQEQVLEVGGGSYVAPVEAWSVYTGEPITKEQSKQRALAVMIASDPITRPQSGIASADIVVEMEAASGITRLMAVFQSEVPEEIGSIRSARNDYIDLARGLDAVFVHWGGEKRALNRLAADDTNEIDQFANGDIFFRKNDVPAPHNGFTTAEGMQIGLERYEYNRVPRFDDWEFNDEMPRDQRPASGSLSLTYGNPDFNVAYDYNGSTNLYERFQGGKAHKDALLNEQITASNVVVVRANHYVYDNSGGYLQFDFENGGDCTVFQNGQEIECKWQKGSQDKPLMFKDVKGDPIELVRGKTWVQVMLPTAQVEWQPERSGSYPE